MKSYIQLVNLANTYYDFWTDDGIDTFHADAAEIAAWLMRDDLRTDADTALDDLTDDEIRQIAEMIADKAKENLDSEDVEMELAEIESESGKTLFVSPDAKPLDGKRVRAFVTVKIPGYYAKRVTWEDGVNLVLFRESDDADPDDPYDVPDLDAITFTDDGKPALWFFREGRNIKIELEVVSRRPNRVAHTF